MSTNLEIEQEKDREKGKVGGRPAKLNKEKGDRDLYTARDKQQRRRTFFCLKNNIIIF